MLTIRAITGGEGFRALTLSFVEKILVVEATLSEISVRRFRGQPLLFSDSAAKLKEQLDFAERALELFNSLAREAKFLELNRDEISSRLRAEVDQQVWRSVLVARGEMLGVFGNESDLRANFDELVFLIRCGGLTSPSSTGGGQPDGSVAIAGSRSQLTPGANYQFTAKVVGTSGNPGVSWAVATRMGARLIPPGCTLPPIPEHFL